VKTVWEACEATSNTSRVLMQDISAYGTLGWELVSVVTRPHPVTKNGTIFHAFMKRKRVRGIYEAQEDRELDN
jgi:hypothetical protein